MDTGNQNWFSRFFLGPINEANDLNARSEAFAEPGAFDVVEPIVQQGSVASAGGTSPLPGVIPPVYGNTGIVTVESALSLGSVYRAVDVLANSVQQLELGVWRGNAEVKNTPAVVSRPDVNSNASKFLKKTTISLATNGNAYWRVTRSDATAPVTNLEVLNPLGVNLSYDNNGNRVYSYNNGVKTVDLKEWQIKHLRLMEIPGSDFGLGPIQAAQGELRNNLNLRHYSGQVFSEYPSGIVSAKDFLDKDMAQAYSERWYEDEANGRRIRFLGNGMTYQPILLAPEDAQFLENQSFSITQVARLFGIPANYMLADAGNSQTYQNMEQVDTAFVKYTLTGYLREIEEAFSDLLPRGQKARFKLEGFLRADDKTRAEVNKTYKEMGVLSAEEIRIAEGWGPMPDDLKNQTKAPAPQAPNAAPPQNQIPEGGNTNE